MAILAEKYATDYKWYVDVILNLIRLAGDYVSEEVPTDFRIRYIRIQKNTRLRNPACEFPFNFCFILTS